MTSSDIRVVEINGLWHVQENGNTMQDAVFTYERNAREEARCIIRLRLLTAGCTRDEAVANVMRCSEVCP